MPAIEALLFQEDDGSVPLIDWLDGIPPKARAKCVGAIRRLESLGHELRRPEADYLRDDIYELRVALQGIRYRMLYFFHGRQAAVLTGGLTKERAVPPQEIGRAVEKRKRYLADPHKHSFRPEGH